MFFILFAFTIAFTWYEQALRHRWIRLIHSWNCKRFRFLKMYCYWNSGVRNHIVLQTIVVWGKKRWKENCNKKPWVLLFLVQLKSKGRCKEVSSYHARILSGEPSGANTGTGTGTGTKAWTRKNELYVFKKNFSYCTLNVPVFQVLKLFQVVCFNYISMVFRCQVMAPDAKSVNGSE